METATDGGTDDDPQAGQAVDDTVEKVAGEGPVTEAVDGVTDAADKVVGGLADGVKEIAEGVTEAAGSDHRRRGRLDSSPTFGAWRSLVARTVRVGEVPSSNLGAPMIEASAIWRGLLSF